MIELSTNTMSSQETGSHTPAIEFQTVSKSFGEVQALRESGDHRRGRQRRGGSAKDRGLDA
jgi:hypothetical protein